MVKLTRAAVGCLVILSVGVHCDKPGASNPDPQTENRTSAPRPISLEEAQAFGEKLAKSLAICDPVAVAAAFDISMTFDIALAGIEMPAAQRQRILSDEQRGNQQGTLMCQGGNFKLGRVYLAGGAARVVFRRIAGLAVAYQEHELGPSANGQIRIHDTFYFAFGQRKSDMYRETVTSMLDKSLHGGELGRARRQLQEVNRLKAAGDSVAGLAALRKLPRVLREKRGTRILELGLLSLGGAPEEYLAAIDAYAKRYPGDRSLDFVVLDGWLASGEWDELHSAINRIEEQVGKDAYLEQYRATAELTRGNLSGAQDLIASAIKQEPGLEVAHWTAVSIYTKTDDFEKLAAELDILKKQFGVYFPDSKVRSDAGLQRFLLSDSGRAWSEANRAEQNTLTPEPNP